MGKTSRPYIFIDTCSLLESCWTVGKNESYAFSQDKADFFWEHELKRLAERGKIILPKRNYDELVRLEKRPGVSNRSEEVLKRVADCIANNEMQIVGDPNDPFADAVLLSVALRFKMQCNQIFVTQDRKLALDLEAIRHFESLTDHPKYDKYDIALYRVGRSGQLQRWYGLDKLLAQRYSPHPSNKGSTASFVSPKEIIFHNKGGLRGSTPHAHQPSKQNWWDS